MGWITDEEKSRDAPELKPSIFVASESRHSILSTFRSLSFGLLVGANVVGEGVGGIGCTFCVEKVGELVRGPSFPNDGLGSKVG